MNEEGGRVFGASTSGSRQGRDVPQENLLSQPSRLADRPAMAVSPLEEVTYFSAYNSLIHQKEMLEDTVRMDAYHDAILENAENFKDKVVLDVGCGTGVLALFAANAGARKVYAVEATRAANLARKLVAANKKEDIVTVIHSKVEEVELPEKVDVIVSEWMGESHVLGADKSVSDRLCARLADQCSLSLSLSASLFVGARAHVSLIIHQVTFCFASR